MIHTRWEPRPPATWERWAEAPTATLFQQPRWFRAITRAYSRDRPRFLTAYADGSPVGLIPMVERSRWGIRQWLSLPFGTHGGPLLAPEAPAGTVEALGEAFARRARDPRTLRFEMSLYDPPSVVREGLQPHLGAYFQEFRTHVIDLSPGFDAIWNGAYFRNTRNCVRMAERADVTVAREQGEAAVAPTDH